MGEGGGAANGRAKDDIKTWMKQRNDHVRTLRQKSAGPSRTAAESSQDGDGLAPRVAAGALADMVGIGAGAVRGAAHLAEGARQGGQIMGRVLDPFYGPLHPTSPALKPMYQAAEGTLHAAKAIAMDPAGTLRRANTALNPFASPMAPTVAGEMQRDFHIGMNQGEAGLNLAAGATAPETMAVRPLTVEEQAARWMARGMPEPVARYMTEPYVGMGSHNYPRGAKLPKQIGSFPLPPFLAGRPMPLPKAISDSPFNVLKPKGISRGDMYELHYKVDTHYQGGSLPRRLGKSWSGKALGLERYGPIGRVVHGAPTALKQTVGGAAGGAGGVLSAAHRESRP